MKPTWEFAGYRYISAPFLWDDSLKGHIVVLRRQAMTGACCTLSVHSSEAQAGGTWRFRESVMPWVGIHTLSPDIDRGTWVRLEVEYSPQHPEEPDVTVL